MDKIRALVALESRIPLLEKENREAKSRINVLTAKNNELEEKQEHWATEIAKRDILISELEDEINILKDESRARSSRKAEESEQCTKLTNANAELQSLLQKAEQTLLVKSHEHISALNQVNCLQSEITKLKCQPSPTTTTIQISNNKEVAGLKDKVNGKIQKIIKLRQQVAEYKKDLEAQTKSRSEDKVLESKLATAKETIEKRDKKIQSIQTKLDEKEEECDKLKKALSTMKQLEDKFDKVLNSSSDAEKKKKRSFSPIMSPDEYNKKMKSLVRTSDSNLTQNAVENDQRSSSAVVATSNRVIGKQCPKCKKMCQTFTEFTSHTCLIPKPSSSFFKSLPQEKSKSARCVRCQKIFKDEDSMKSHFVRCSSKFSIDFIFKFVTN